MWRKWGPCWRSSCYQLSATRAWCHFGFCAHFSVFFRFYLSLSLHLQRFYTRSLYKDTHRAVEKMDIRQSPSYHRGPSLRGPGAYVDFSRSDRPHIEHRVRSTERSPSGLLNSIWQHTLFETWSTEESLFYGRVTIYIETLQISRCIWARWTLNMEGTLDFDNTPGSPDLSEVQLVWNVEGHSRSITF